MRGGDGPKVSVVTPSMNQGRFIRRTIESVLRQDYANVEYWVIDGGSHDETLSILREFDDRVHWVSEPDRGQSHAINKGFGMASGDIFAYLNSDDTYMPHALSTVVRVFQERANATWLYGACRWITEDDQEIAIRPPTQFDLHKLLWGDHPIDQPSVFWTRKAMDVCGPFDESMHYAMDYDYWLRLAHHGRPLICREILSSFRDYQENKSHRHPTAMIREAFDARRKWLEPGVLHALLFRWRYLKCRYLPDLF